MNYLIGTDIGTSGTKTIVMDTNGRLISSDYMEYGILTPQPLWAEQWPDVWEEAVVKTIRTAVEKSGVHPSAVKGLCISGLYGGSGVPVDSEMQPVRPCIIWMDRRAEVEQRWLIDSIGEKEIYNVTRNGTDPYYGYTKMLWIKNNERENWSRIKRFVPPNAYVIYQLTGQLAIDYSSAGNIGGIFDATSRQWSAEMLDRMGIPSDMMPDRIVESSAVVGGLTDAAAKSLGLLQGTPVCAGGVDCVVATLGMGVFEAGSYAAAIGTSMCAAFVHESNVQSESLIQMPYVIDAQSLSYSFGGAATAGVVIKWFRDNFAVLEKQIESNGGRNAYAVLDAEAEKIPPGSEGVIVLPYFMGERSPVWDTNARGVIYGLSLYHSRAHIYRAMLEAVAYSLRHTIESVGVDVGSTILLAGGAARSGLWRHIISDVTGKKVLCPVSDVEATLGDVILAGVGTGCLTLEDVKKWNILDNEIAPDPRTQASYDKGYIKYRSLYCSLKDEFKSQ